ncbi:MAG: hypothetical protein GVY24_02390 [Planctomycetes bacterium]|jgi:hypothetical protein|nr:hypothetical protein [Planctomycetota bacterium]
MGLTIHYTLTATRFDTDQSRASIEAMRQVALRAGLEFVSELHHDTDPATDPVMTWGAMYPGRRIVETGREMPEREVKPFEPMTDEEIEAAAQEMVESWEEKNERRELGLDQDEPSAKEQWQAEFMTMTDGAFIDLDPLETIWFFATSKGSEPFIVGLARYPRVVEHQSQDGPIELETGLGVGWHWEGFCKTQYASMPHDGGSEDHFVATHRAFCDILRAGEDAGIHVDVHDESKFYEQRDEAELRATVQRWNRMTAAVAGKIMDSDRDVASPILGHPEFEHLEAEGERELENYGKRMREQADPEDA